MAAEYTIPHGKHPNVYKGDRVFAGQQLTDGPVVPHDILKVCGDKVLQEYLLSLLLLFCFSYCNVLLYLMRELCQLCNLVIDRWLYVFSLIGLVLY